MSIYLTLNDLQNQITELSSRITNLSSVLSTVAVTASDGLSGSLLYAGQLTGSAISSSLLYTNQLTSSAILIQQGNLIISSSGNGIDFSANTNDESTPGSAVTSEIFDDYEEGTWTPQISGSTVTGSTTYTTQTGTYTKIGNMVFLQTYVVWSNNTGGSGNLLVGNLPFAATSSNAQATGMAQYANLSVTTGSIAFVQSVSGQNYLKVLSVATGSSGGVVTSNDVALDTAATLGFSISYQTA